MKRKKTNITTASLRSASSKRSRKATLTIDNKSAQTKNKNNSSYTTSTNKQYSSKKRKKFPLDLQVKKHIFAMVVTRNLDFIHLFKCSLINT